MATNDPYKAFRVRNTLALIKSRFHGNNSAFARAVDRSASQINDMLAEPPRKPYGEKLARAFEVKLGLPPHTLDSENTPPPIAAEERKQYAAHLHAPLPVSDEARRVAAMWDKLPSDIRSNLYGIIEFNYSALALLGSDSRSSEKGAEK